jgi:predicted RNA-binding Zn-ribbon protein involved in translation (DUF1610 family)
MGMFDTIKDFKTKCPNCGAVVGEFQSKDGSCSLDMIDYWTVNNFYSSCTSCDTWIEYTLKRPRGKIPIRDYIRHYGKRK